MFCTRFCNAAFLWLSMGLSTIVSGTWLVRTFSHLGKPYKSDHLVRSFLYFTFDDVMFLLLFLSCCFVAAVVGDITGTDPAPGSCICLDATGVNVRDSGDLSSIHTLKSIHTD